MADASSKPDPMQQVSGQDPGQPGAQLSQQPQQTQRPDPMQEVTGQQPNQSTAHSSQQQTPQSDPMRQVAGNEPNQSTGPSQQQSEPDPMQQVAGQAPRQEMQQNAQQTMPEPDFHPPPPNQGISALVFGASGITGYAIMRALLDYPTPTAFARIIGLTNRPLSRDVSQLPHDARIEIYSDMDLLNREQSLSQLAAIPGIDTVTHVYFASYTGHYSKPAELRQTNELLLTNAVGGVEICCPNLQFFSLQTGGKAYGVEYQDKVPYNPPLREDMPRIPEPYAQNIFYYPQYDIMTNASTSKPWTFCEIRPDAIVGFVPQNNNMNIAQAIGLFLSLWKELEVEGGAPRAVPFPASREAWTALHTDTSQDILARFHIYASLRPQLVSGEAFNVADGPASTWESKWPRLCEYFGLRGVGPDADSTGFNAQAWMEKQEKHWQPWVEKFGLKEGALQGTSWTFMQAVMGIPFRRDYDLSKSRGIGFTEERPDYMGYFKCFDEMKRAKIIP